jgi:hypothetical protein
MENKWEQEDEYDYEDEEDTFGKCPTMKQQLIDMAMDAIHGELTIPMRYEEE